MIKIVSNYSDMDAELDRIGSMPTPSMVAGLDGVLETGFEATRALVHVDTGKLKASGVEKNSVGGASWSGQFSFPAPNKKGTPYGIYELARGGTHDFLRNVNVISKMLGLALVDGLRKKN